MHETPVVDLAFCQTNKHLLASVSQRGDAKITRVNIDRSDNSNASQTVALIKGHHRNIIGCKWHPTSKSSVVTWSVDRTIKVWNTDFIHKNGGTSDCVTKPFVVQNQRIPFHVEFDSMGKLMGVTDRSVASQSTSSDKLVKVYDLRTKSIAQETLGMHGFSKTSLHFADQLNYVVVVGLGLYKTQVGGKALRHQIKIYDKRQMSRALSTRNFDGGPASDASSIPHSIAVHFDNKRSLLHMRGRSNSELAVYEVNTTGKLCHPVHTFQCSKGVEDVAWFSHVPGYPNSEPTTYCKGNNVVGIDQGKGGSFLTCCFCCIRWPPRARVCVCLCEHIYLYTCA